MKKNMSLITTLLLLQTVPQFIEAKNEDKNIREFHLYNTSFPSIATTLENYNLINPSDLEIELSDGSKWIILAKEENDLDSSCIYSWEKNDDIRIDMIASSKLFRMKNVNFDQTFICHLSSKFTQTEKTLFIKKIDREGYVLILNDDSIWSIGWIGSFVSHNWRVGDRMIVNKSYHYKQEDYELINAKNLSRCSASIVQWR